MVKAKLGYKGEGLTGSEPESCVVKLSLGRTDQALSERVAMAVLGLYEEDIFRTEWVAPAECPGQARPGCPCRGGGGPSKRWRAGGHSGMGS